MPEPIDWPPGTPEHIRRPLCPNCTHCGRPMPRAERHACAPGPTRATSPSPLRPEREPSEPRPSAGVPAPESAP